MIFWVDWPFLHEHWEAVQNISPAADQSILEISLITESLLVSWLTTQMIIRLVSHCNGEENNKEQRQGHQQVYRSLPPSRQAEFSQADTCGQPQ